MLSYQHIFHAGNLADVHKHALLAWILAYLVKKPKPFSYLETHAGRGLYDLTSGEARKTGEAAQGIRRLLELFPARHPYRQTLDAVTARHGADAYPGSPAIAAHWLRAEDRAHLAELHPQEFEVLRRNMRAENCRVYHQDGVHLAHSLCPPTPRRGLMLIDPSWEIKTDYDTMARTIAKISKAWNVGTVVLWYPILQSNAHSQMLRQLQDGCEGGLRHEVRFPPIREGHRMIGSGLFVTNPPWGCDAAAREISRIFEAAFR